MPNKANIPDDHYDLICQLVTDKIDDIINNSDIVVKHPDEIDVNIVKTKQFYIRYKGYRIDLSTIPKLTIQKVSWKDGLGPFRKLLCKKRSVLNIDLSEKRFGKTFEPLIYKLFLLRNRLEEDVAKEYAKRYVLTK